LTIKSNYYIIILVVYIYTTKRLTPFIAHLKQHRGFGKYIENLNRFCRITTYHDLKVLLLLPILKYKFEFAKHFWKSILKYGYLNLHQNIDGSEKSGLEDDRIVKGQDFESTSELN